MKRNEYQSEVRAARVEAWRKFCEDMEGIPPTSRLHKLLTNDSSSSPGTLMKPNGEYTKSPVEAAKLLLDTHFPGNVSRNETDPEVNELDHTSQIDDVLTEIVTPEKVTWTINSFRPYKSPGVDEIYPIMLQIIMRYINPFLCSIYKSALAFGYIPKIWQKVKVIFIPKPGKSDYTAPKSFRPISLTSFLLKGLERLIDRYMKDDFDRRNLPFNGQHAFQESKSTETALSSQVR